VKGRGGKEKRTFLTSILQGKGRKRKIAPSFFIGRSKKKEGGRERKGKVDYILLSREEKEKGYVFLPTGGRGGLRRGFWKREGRPSFGGSQKKEIEKKGGRVSFSGKEKRGREKRLFINNPGGGGEEALEEEKASRKRARVSRREKKSKSQMQKERGVQLTFHHLGKGKGMGKDSFREHLREGGEGSVGLPDKGERKEVFLRHSKREKRGKKEEGMLDDTL